MRHKFGSDKQKLGWFGTAWLLSLLLSSSAWALDFHHETSRHEFDATDLSSTLGRSRGLKVAPTKPERRDGLHVALEHARKLHPIHLKPKAPKRLARKKSKRRRA